MTSTYDGKTAQEWAIEADAIAEGLRREDAPWRVRHSTNRRSPFGARLPDRSYVFNRYGDLIAECMYGPDAEFIAQMVLPLAPQKPVPEVKPCRRWTWAKNCPNRRWVHVGYQSELFPGHAGWVHGCRP